MEEEKDPFVEKHLNKVHQLQDHYRNLALMKKIEISTSGYGGVLPSGEVVDRREHPAAIPLQANSMFGVPEPKDL
ncbi:hypothetical protein [Rufibacter soli]